MTFKEKVEVFKALFAETVEVKFADFKLEDGTIVTTEALEAGKVLEIISEDGTKSFAPEGKHKLDDGRVVVIEGTEGVIKEVIEAVAEETEDAEMAEDVPVAEDVPTEAPAEDSNLEARVLALEEVVAKLMEEMAKAKEDVPADDSNIAVEMSKLKEENEALKATIPAVESVNFKKIDVTKAETKVETKGKYAQYIEQNKK